MLAKSPAFSTIPGWGPPYNVGIGLVETHLVLGISLQQAVRFRLYFNPATVLPPGNNPAAKPHRSLSRVRKRNPPPVGTQSLLDVLGGWTVSSHRRECKCGLQAQWRQALRLRHLEISIAIMPVFQTPTPLTLSKPCLVQQPWLRIVSCNRFRSDQKSENSETIDSEGDV